MSQLHIFRTHSLVTRSCRMKEKHPHSSTSWRKPHLRIPKLPRKLAIITPQINIAANLAAERSRYSQLYSSLQKRRKSARLEVRMIHRRDCEQSFMESLRRWIVAVCPLFGPQPCRWCGNSLI